MKRRSEEKKNLCSRAIFARVHKGWSLSWGGWYRLLCCAVAPPGISAKDHRAFLLREATTRKERGFLWIPCGFQWTESSRVLERLFFYSLSRESVSISFWSPIIPFYVHKGKTFITQSKVIWREGLIQSWRQDNT